MPPYAATDASRFEALEKKARHRDICRAYYARHGEMLRAKARIRMKEHRETRKVAARIRLHVLLEVAAQIGPETARIATETENKRLSQLANTKVDKGRTTIKKKRAVAPTPASKPASIPPQGKSSHGSSHTPARVKRKKDTKLQIWDGLPPSDALNCRQCDSCICTDCETETDTEDFYQAKDYDPFWNLRGLK